MSAPTGKVRLFRVLRLVLVVFCALLIQLAVVSDLPVMGAVGDLMLVLTVAAGSLTDPDRGAVYGFAVGLTYDLTLGTPFGLSALVYALVGYGVGIAGGWLLEPRRWFYVTVAVAAGVVAVVTTVGVAMLLGLMYPLEEVVRIAVVVAVWNGLLILPARRLMQWVVGSDEPDGFWMALP